MQADVRSLLTPLGYQAGDCGYCKGNDTSASYYARSKVLTVDDYQRLVDRGWRRSGTLLYKPDVLRACCPHYTIRLPAASLKPSRDQRQAVNRWNKHVLGDKYIQETAKRYPISREAKKLQKEGFDLIASIHESEASQLKPVESAHKFEVTLEPDKYTEEKFNLYKDYQAHVHHDPSSEISKAGFRRFLCESPLVRRKESMKGKEKLLGSYHQCYRLDGQLIAMAVLDLLPHAVSGVYFLYHQDVERWSFGKMSALREAALAIEGQYEYYYMGYYIHNCIKMRYKGEYKPQHVLDPLTYAWHSMDDMKPLLDKDKFVSFGQTAMEVDPPEPDTPSDEDEFKGPDGNMWKYRSPAEAGTSGDSLFNIRMPGVPTATELLQEVDLDVMSVSLGPGMVFKTQDLTVWGEDNDITQTTLKGAIAELAACVGPEVAMTMALDFSR